MSATVPEAQFERTNGAGARPLRRARAPAAPAAAARPLARALIVSDCSTFVPPFTAGGTERQLSDLARQLELCGVEVTVVVREAPAASHAPPASHAHAASHAHPFSASAPAPADELRTQYVPPAPVPKGSGWAALGPNVAYIARTFIRLLRARREYDALIVSGFRQLALPIALLARLARKPCIVRIDAAWDLEDDLTPESNARIGAAAQRIASALIRASRSLAFRMADHLIAFSDPLERRLIALGAKPDKIKQIPNGVDTRRFAPPAAGEKSELRRVLGLPPDRAIFVYTGRIARSKGLLELLGIWERFADRGGVYLLLVGQGATSHESCEAEVAEAVARHPDSIGWRGAVENVAQYLKASDVFIFLSYFESFSLSLVEAVASGLPCIVSDVGCARQVVRHHENGAIVPVRAEPETVLRELDWVLARRDSWESMGAEARTHVVNTYDLEAVARRYVALFDLAGARGPPQSPRRG